MDHANRPGGDGAERVATAADGTRIAYRVSGSGSPLVLLPGQANDHRWWGRVAPVLAEHHTVLAPDPRGTGHSDAPTGPYTTRGMAEDVVAILDDAGVGRAHLYGASMGGRVAQWFAVDHADRLGALVLGCTSPGGDVGVERGEEVRRSLAVRDEDLRRARLLDLMYTPGWLAAHPGPYHVVGSEGMTHRTRRWHLHASETHDASQVLGRITAPTLVLHGADDRMTPVANLELLCSRIPGARGHVFAGARHAYFDECAEDRGAAAGATRLVLEHLRAHDHLAADGETCEHPDTAADPTDHDTQTGS